MEKSNVVVLKNGMFQWNCTADSQANLTSNTVYRTAHQYPRVSLYFV